MNGTIEKCREIAQNMGYSWICATRPQAGEMLDRYRRQYSTQVTPESRKTFPVIICIQPSGGRFEIDSMDNVRDIPSVLFAFAEPMKLDTPEPEMLAIIEELKGVALHYTLALRESGEFSSVSMAGDYNITFDRYDANLCILEQRIELTPKVGECVDKYLQEW